MVNVLQWNPSNMDTIPPLKCALIREVFSFQRCPLGGVPHVHTGNTYHRSAVLSLMPAALVAMQVTSLPYVDT